MSAFVTGTSKYNGEETIEWGNRFTLYCMLKLLKKKLFSTYCGSRGSCTKLDKLPRLMSLVSVFGNEDTRLKMEKKKKIITKK